MIRYIIIIVLGLFLGLSKKEVPNIEVLKLLFIDAILIGAVFGGGFVLGYDFWSIALLRKHTVLASTLTVLYAFIFALMIKYAMNSFKKNQNKK